MSREWNCMGKYVFLGEGVRGSLSKQVIAKYDLGNEAESQKYGLGMKEIWEIDPDKHREGTVTHTMGWPLGKNAGGGSFIYHLDNNQVYVGFVVHLNYANPYLFPYMEFQRFKHHPMVAELLKGGKRVAYGARAITEGGYQSMPKAAFPGGALLGCSVGSGQRAAHQGQPQRHAVGQGGGGSGPCRDQGGPAGDVLDDYAKALKTGPIGKDLKRVRNVKPLWSKHGLLASLTIGGFDMWTNNLFGLSLLGTLKHGKTDAAATGKAVNIQADRLSQARRHAVLRPADQCQLFDHQPRGKPARASAPDGSVHPDQGQPAGVRRTRAALLPGGRLRGGRGTGQGPAFRHQLPELRPLQDLRYQGPQPEHRLDGAAGRRRAELSEHVTRLRESCAKSQPRIAQRPRAG